MMPIVVQSLGIRWYQSPLLDEVGVIHAFTTRQGGVSPPPFDSLNLGPTSNLPAGVAGDDPARIERNYDRLQAALGCRTHRRAWVRQVHGCEVVAMPMRATLEHPEADAMWTDDPHVLLSVRVADCLPILLASKDGRVVAAVHAGWRGIVGGVIARAVASLNQQAQRPPQQLVAAVGPGIGLEHFEVGPEVAEAFAAAGLSSCVHPWNGGRPHVDLADAARRQLQQCGLSESDIHLTGLCTVANGDFFSHRRDKGQTGRFAGVIAVRRS